MRLLHISNEPVDGFGRFKVALSALKQNDQISETLSIHPRGKGTQELHAYIAESIEQYDPDIIFIQSQHQAKWTSVEAALLKASGAHTVYWEGDAWGARKKLPMSSKQLMVAADFVYSVMPTDLLGRLAGLTVRPTWLPHVLPLGMSKVEPSSNIANKVAHVGNHLQRIPVVGGLPGSRERLKLVEDLHRKNCIDVYGSGWPRKFGSRYVNFREQVPLITRYAASVNWDHFPGYSNYFSDRLAISLAAGRPHLTTKHPGMEWLTSSVPTLQLFSTPSDLGAAARIHALAPPDTSESTILWIYEHLTDLQALQFMLRPILGTADEFVWE